jgi:phosphatidylserine/phosphatidylglycerophosphate/cardiolipin synthase-like enzyme
MHWNRTTNPMFGKVALWCSLCLGLSASVRHCSFAEEIRLLENDTNAIHARLQLIQESEREIVIAYHDSDSGQVFTQIGNALADRAQQGVRVRLLVDGLVSKQSYDQLHELSMRQVEVKIFHPLGTKSIRWLNRRLHSKIMVSDEDTMIMGSRNLTDANFGLACDNYVDADYCIRGDLCRCGKQYFDWLWNVEGAVDIRQAVQWQAHRKPEDTSDETCQHECASCSHGPSEPTDAMGRCITPSAALQLNFGVDGKQF